LGQEAWVGSGATARLIRLPAQDTEVIPGVRWGAPDIFNTPAYWAVRCEWPDAVPDFSSGASTLIMEVGFCLLGGFGIKYEVNAAAFERLDANGCFEECGAGLSEEEIRDLLLEPLAIGDRTIRYRFPNQRAKRLFRMRQAILGCDLRDISASDLRNRLLAIEGIGPKTASWIVRNCLGSDEVAIIDVHLLRACRAMNLFPDQSRLPQDYAFLERRFLEFSSALAVRPSLLDAIIWSEVRNTGYYGARR